MLMDILIALLIVVVAAALGLVVHPLLWFVAIARRHLAVHPPRQLEPLATAG